MAVHKQTPILRVKISLPKKAPSLQAVPSKKIIVTTFILNGVTIIVTVISQKFTPPQVPLFYGLAEGEAQLAPSLGLVVPALTATAIAIINSLIALFIRNEFIQQVLILAAFAAGVLALITTIKILSLVGSF